MKKFRFLIALVAFISIQGAFAQNSPSNLSPEGGGHTAGGIISADGIRENANARARITEVINYHRHNKGFAAVTPEDIFGKKTIIDETVQIQYPFFTTLGELRAYLLSTRAVKEAGIDMVMSITINMLGKSYERLAPFFVDRLN